MNDKPIPPTTILFDGIYYASLNYTVSSTGIVIQDEPQNKTLRIRVMNSRKGITPGYIVIPVEKIPELITALTAVYTARPK